MLFSVPTLCDRTPAADRGQWTLGPILPRLASSIPFSYFFSLLFDNFHFYAIVDVRRFYLLLHSDTYVLGVLAFVKIASYFSLFSSKTFFSYYRIVYDTLASWARYDCGYTTYLWKPSKARRATCNEVTRYLRMCLKTNLSL